MHPPMVSLCRRCQRCKDVMCAECFQAAHQKGIRASHNASILPLGPVACCRCAAVCDVMCKGCGGAHYCRRCFRRRHKLAGWWGSLDHQPAPLS